MNRMKSIYSVIVGSGRYVPERVVKNEDFLNHEFYCSEGLKIPQPNEEIIEKFKSITGIEERRHVEDDMSASDIAFFAAEKAIADADIDPETLDYIIVAHNFGDVKEGSIDILPSLASRVKNKLRIVNHNTVAYDLIFGCPGWVQAMIQANYYIKSGDAKRILVIGAETLSKISDPHDRDSMIYADGAGATILEARESETPIGIISHKTRTDTLDHAYMLWLGKSRKKDSGDPRWYLSMNGRKLYEYALNTVPVLAKECIDKSGLGLGDIKKVLIHQANEKMDEAILKRVFRLYKVKDMPAGIMPMNIRMIGNNSVATVPVLYDMIRKQDLDNHSINSGDAVLFTSVGAGMNINAFVYKTP